MKEKIIHQAANLFVTLGFKSVTMDDIASEMGISKKTIYAHFTTKTALVKAATLYIFNTISAGITEIRNHNNNPIAELFEIKKYVMLALKDEKSSPQHQLQKYYPEVAKEMEVKNFSLMQECTVGNLKKGIADKLYRPNIDINLISRIYFVGVSGLKDERLFPSQLFPKAQLQEDYLEYHLRGIVTPEGLNILNKFIKTNH